MSKHTQDIRAAPDRRQVLGGIAASAALFCVAEARAAQRITIRDGGGAVGGLLRKAFYDPFTKETGVEVVSVTSQHEPVAQIKLMVETRNYDWDMLIAPKGVVLSADDYLADLGPSVLNDANVKDIPANFKSAKQIGTSAYATILSYRTDRYPKGPESWADLFDLTKFSGRRALRKAPFDTIEIALLADGVKPADLYPCDLDRAFKKLQSVKNEIAVWWSAGAQASQLLRTGEVDIIPTWSSRAFAAITDGAPAKIMWNQALYTYEGAAILKGSPNSEACRELAKFCARPDRQALLAELLGGPTNPGAFKYISAEKAPQLPTSPKLIQSMIQIDEEFWMKARAAAVERFNAWLLA